MYSLFLLFFCFFFVYVPPTRSYNTEEVATVKKLRDGRRVHQAGVWGRQPPIVLFSPTPILSISNFNSLLPNPSLTCLFTFSHRKLPRLKSYDTEGGLTRRGFGGGSPQLFYFLQHRFFQFPTSIPFCPTLPLTFLLSSPTSTSISASTSTSNRHHHL